MSLFSFNFRPKRLNEFNDNKENVFKPFTPLSMRSESSVGSKQPVFGHTLTPTQRSLFGNKSNDSVEIQKSFEVMSDENKVSEGLTIDSTVQQISEDSNILKQRITAELERIETFKTMSEMEINRQSDEIKSLKSIIEDYEKRLDSMRRENSELTVKLNVESTERKGVLSRMNTTRDMMVKITQLFQHIENRLEALDDVKDAFDLLNKTRSQQFDELNQLFCDLDFKHKTIVSRLESDITQKNTEWNVLSEALDRKTYDLELYKSESNKRFECLAEEINGYKDMKQSLESSVNHKEVENKELTQKLLEMEERHQSIIISGQKKDEEFEKYLKVSEIQRKELETKIETLLAKENDLLKRIDELKAEIESNRQKNHNFEVEIKKKDQSIADLNSEIEAKAQEMMALLSEKTGLLQLNDELNSKVVFIENEKQEFETSFQSEKQSLIGDYEKTIKEMESNVETLREENKQLVQCKESNVVLIDELESKANQSMVEKEVIEQQLTNDLKKLREEFDNNMNEFSAKIQNLEKRIQELTQLKEQNENKINDTLSENEVLKLEKEELKQKLEREERTLENQMSNMSKILESCKSDYSKRIEDKEDRIKEYRRESERMRHSIEILNKKCERLENEKQLTNSKLQELTLSAMRPTTSSPNRVLTPKFMSPIESTRLSANRSSSPFVKSLDLSPNLVAEEDFILSAKQELLQNLKIKSSQNSQTLKKLAPILPQKDLKSKAKNESKQMAAKGREVKKLAKLNDSNSSESVYEVIEEKLMKTKKGVRKQRDGAKHRIDSPVKVNMSSVDDQIKQKKDCLDTTTEEYDIEKVDKEPPFKKKMKTIPTNLKTYAKKGLRTENVMKGKPTPTKSGDLSWLNF